VSGANPPHLRHDPSLFAAKQARIFAKAWDVLRHVNTVPEAGDCSTARLGAQNMLVVRRQDDVPHAFNNVCQHRAHELPEDRGNPPQILRPYHAWSDRRVSLYSSANQPIRGPSATAGSIWFPLQSQIWSFLMPD
jgi:phenylpropionate dioxygenase-like ring-hydroxylating dioxygenase large terminal subunit